jgi:hypothetical protein
MDVAQSTNRVVALPRGTAIAHLSLDDTQWVMTVGLMDHDFVVTRGEGRALEHVTTVAKSNDYHEAHSAMHEDFLKYWTPQS